MTLYRKLLLICLGSLALRLVLLPFVEHPGVGDPNHYYNLGARLSEGQGFNIDYVWQYNDPPNDLIHPEDYWMPLTSIFVAASMSLFGVSVHAAVLPFILMGVLIPLVAYAAARQFECSEETALFAAAAAGVLPEFVLNSMRTETTIPNVLLVCVSILLLTYGLKQGGWRIFALSGLLAGLAYLVRSDSSLLLPMLIVTLLVYRVWARKSVTTTGNWRYAILMPLVAFVVVAPWTMRNLNLNGTVTTPKIDQMFYLTDFREHFVYDEEISLRTLLERQTLGQLLGKRLFEMAASVKIMYTTLDVFLPIAVAGGLLLVIRGRSRDRLLTLAPTLILLGGVFVFYTILVPFKSQAGSLKKAYLTLIPLLLPLASYALEQAIPDRRIRFGTMILVVGIMGANAFELVRIDNRNVQTYRDTMDKVVETVHTLPDTNGDNEIILMTQDPFMLRFYGIRSVMTPMDDRESILEVAERYGVDYVLMPPARPALDDIALGTEIDPRIEYVIDVPGTTASFFRFVFEAD